MADSCGIPPFKPVFGALNPVLVKKPKDKDEFIDNAQKIMGALLPQERQILRGAISKIKSGKLRFGDWPCIAIFLEIAELAKNLDPNDLY